MLCGMIAALFLGAVSCERWNLFMKRLMMTVGLLIASVSMSAANALAQDAPAATPTPNTTMTPKGGKWNLTPEQRENMAKLHEQMANCLRSTKTMKECHEEMRKSCESLGANGCPMMGWEHGKKGHHMHHHENE